MLESQKAKGNDPEALRNRPELPWYCYTLLQDFHRLSRSRTYHMSGPNAIDIVAILEYNQRVSKEPAELFIDLMQDLDSVYLDATAKKAKQKQKKSAGMQVLQKR